MQQPLELQAADKDRYWHFRAPPKDTTRGALVVTVFALLVVACFWRTLSDLRVALASLSVTGKGSDALLVLLGVGGLYPLVPALRSLRAAQRARRAVASGELAAARTAASASRSDMWTSAGLAVSLLVMLGFIQFLIANDLAVSRTFFQLPLMVETMPLVVKAFWTNIHIFMVAEVLVLIVGLAAAIARMTPGPAGRPIRVLAVTYIDIFRGLPAIITIYLVGFGISLTGLPVLKDLSPESFAIIALTLTSSSYVAEIYRAGIESIHWSQTAASRSLGLSYAQTLRFIVIPQAVRRMIPPLLNQFISLQKDTALVNIIGSMDSFNQAKIIASNHFNLSAVSTVAIIFIVITIPQTRLVDRLIEKRRLAGSM
ncbi:amino acid ABC transporter permease [Paraburkholderia sp.]|jgi:polar amino acid transport system permease protein|uniref:amino acid ABC transporter permease n=1 Tax=Paraburkholderia sp. TaxID=1926495 RepID=UPI002F42C10F